MQTVILTLKKIYFDRILVGEKVIEYRKDSSYYSRLFEKNPSHIIFHYYQKDRLLVKIDSIEKIPRPDHLDQSILPTESVYKIRFSEASQI